MQKSKYCETSTHCDDSRILMIDFLKSEIKSKNAIITMILDDHKNEVRQPKPFGNRRGNNTGNTNDNHEYHFQTPRKSSKMKKADTNKDFFSPDRFRILQDDISGNKHDL